MKKKNNILKKIPMILAALFIIPTITYADDIEANYEGEYSIDYLLRNYNVITFGQNNNEQLGFVTKKDITITKGNANLSIEGPALINGDYENSDVPNDFKLEYSVTNPTKAISHIKGTRGTNVTTTDKTATNADFIDFKKMYDKVLAESYGLVDKTDFHINHKYMNISKPGIYQINSTRIDTNSYGYEHENYAVSANYFLNYGKVVKYVYIDNYDPDSYYIFNNMKLYEYDNYLIFIKKSSDDTFEMLEDYAKTNNYTGNIIFNYPKAKLIIADAYSGKIVAPNADVIISNTSLYNTNNGYEQYNMEIYYHDSIFANSILGFFDVTNDTVEEETEISYKPYTSTKKISVNEAIIEEVEDYADDLYNGAYSISEMLKNYNLITLGQKKYDSKTYFAEKYADEGDYSYGDALIFHIAGHFLINGELVAYRLDLESNRIYESSLLGNYDFPGPSFKRWGDGDSNIGTNSNVFVTDTYDNCYDRMIYNQTPYINFERLYDSITAEQKNIKMGEEVKAENGVAHIKVGTNNFINDINDIKEIVFDDFDQNDSKMTVITVLNNGDINFPKVSQTASGNLVPTKDYFGKEEALFQYEYFNFPDDIYHGNIIWNVPNAKYIKLAANAPFFGHLIAPNADVETPETHFSGNFIVNSLYAEGNSEAHFFPLQAINPPTDYDVKNKTISFGYLGYGEIELKDTIPSEPKPEPNPPTSTGGIILLIVLLVGANVAIIKYRNKKQEIDG